MLRHFESRAAVCLGTARAFLGPQFPLSSLGEPAQRLCGAAAPWWACNALQLELTHDQQPQEEEPGLEDQRRPTGLGRDSGRPLLCECPAQRSLQAQRGPGLRPASHSTEATATSEKVWEAPGFPESPAEESFRGAPSCRAPTVPAEALSPVPLEADVAPASAPPVSRSHTVRPGLAE